MNQNKIKDNWLYIPIIIITLFFIYVLFNLSNIINFFPLDKTSDLTSHMAQLHFLKIYGFHNLVPNWYNGYILFESYTPGWFFVTLPLYQLIDNLYVTAFISIILLYLVGFIAMFYLGKIERFSLTKRVAFFLLFFANPVAVGNFVRVGKLPELMGWIIFILIFLLINHYREQKIDRLFVILLTILLSLAILTYTPIFILTFISFSYFFYKRGFTDKIKILISFLVSILITSFWWIPYFFNTINVNVHPYLITIAMFIKEFYGDIIVSFIAPAMLFFIVYLYYKGEQKEEIKYYLPVLVLAILIFTRLAILIPYLNMIHADTYNFLFIFFSIYLLFKFKIRESYYKNVKYLIVYLLPLIVILGILVYAITVPSVKPYTELDKETISLFPYVSERMLILKNPQQNFKPLYSYASIYYNITTASGWLPEVLSIPDTKKMENLTFFLEKMNCDEIKQSLNYFNVSEIITYDKYCDTMASCGLNRKILKDRICLYTLK